MTYPDHGGKPCEGALKQIEACNTDVCEDAAAANAAALVKDCKIGAWGAWSGCSSTCGGGVQSRSRQVQQPPEHGGMACEGEFWAVLRAGPRP